MEPQTEKNSSPLKIVPAAKKHLYTVTLLTQKFFPYANFNYQEILRRLKDPNIKYFVAEEDGHTVGFVDYQLKPERSSAQILGLAVIEEARRKGIGKKLLVKALEEIRASKDIDGMPTGQVELLVSTRNDTALTLYTKLGFKKRGLLEKKLHDQDILIFVKEY